MMILGIDPGSRFTGWGIIESQGRKLSFIGSGIINVSTEPVFTARVGLIFKEIEKLLKLNFVGEAALESLIHVKNISSLSKLAQARGAIISALCAGGINNICEYSPNLVKSSVTGHGHANKEAVQKSLQMILGQSCFKTSDESDALAIAICHAINRTNSYNASVKSGSKGQSLKQAFKHLEKS